jgi:hypothetical protein
MTHDTTWTEADGEQAAASLSEAIEALLEGIRLAEARLKGQASDDVEVEQAAFERGVIALTASRPLMTKAVRITLETGE